MIGFGLNQVTMATASFGDFVEAAARLGMAGVEVRNDLGRPVFDGIAAETAGHVIQDHGLRLLGVSQVYPFNLWSQGIAEQVETLLEVAIAAGSKSISLIPCNDGTQVASDDLMAALETCLALVKSSGLTALIEPLGFGRSSLRQKSDLVDAIAALGAQAHLKIVHDTFHHTLAGGGELYPRQTGIVHISGVEDELIPVANMEDKHRVLVGVRDRLGNLDQIRSLTDAGYDGVFSFECFAPEVHALTDPEEGIRRSMNFISSHLQDKAA